ncbi:universal stress protein [Natronoarchaeum sp. GCM10025703]|uniref:universal stress protein n=1 Tax=Natronoarchaeum sp. GCM10025703 TaxID=3252685 RepID=UPI00361A504F
MPLKTRLIDGSPRRAIVEYADGHDCDLIVMGTHGRGGINRLLMGSVTEGVIRTSDRPVLTVQLGDKSDNDDQRDDTPTQA